MQCWRKVSFIAGIAGQKEAFNSATFGYQIAPKSYFMQLEKTIFYCTYTRNADEPSRHSGMSHPFPTLEAARDEAAALKPSGYWGTIERAVELLYDDDREFFHDVEIVEQF